MVPPSVTPRISKLLNTANKVEIDARNSCEASTTDNTDKLAIASDGLLRILDAWCDYSAASGWAHDAIALVEDFDPKAKGTSRRLFAELAV